MPVLSTPSSDILEEHFTDLEETESDCICKLKLLHAVSGNSGHLYKQKTKQRACQEERLPP